MLEIAGEAGRFRAHALIGSAGLLVLAGVGASALALGLFARIEWPWLALGWVALVPWLAVLDRARSASAAAVSGLLMSVAFVLAVFGWFASAIERYTAVSPALAVAVLVVLAPLLEPQLVTFAVARHVAQRRGAGPWRTMLVAACVYVGTEWASPKLFADTLGHGLYASVWMRQAADVAGVHGLTCAVVVANECARSALRAMADGRTRFRRAVAPASCAAGLVVGLLVYGAVRCHQLALGDGRDAPVTAGVVQADISQYGRLATELGTFGAVRTILDAHFALSAEVLERSRPDLLVWPETVYPTTFGSPRSEDGAAFDREIGGFVAAVGVPLVFGAYDVDGGDEFNAAVFLEPVAKGRLTFETYRKAWLFPLTERVPALLESPVVRGWLPWLGTWKPGKGAEVIRLAVRGGRTLLIAPLICYDALDASQALAAVREGAELIVTLSNDSWFAGGPGPWLHLVGSAFRSIETRRPQVRATNTGISAVIDPTGEILATAGVHQRATLVARVTPVRGTTTLMVAWGDWFGPTALVCGAILLAGTLAAKRGTTAA